MDFFPSVDAIVMYSSRLSIVGLSLVIIVSCEGDWNSANKFSPSSLEDFSAAYIFSVENFLLCIVESLLVLVILQENSFLDLNSSITERTLSM